MAAPRAGAGGMTTTPGTSERREKVLLMGKSGSGKTSMRSVIFANYLARDTGRLNPTLDVQHSSVRFLGNLVLNLWDCAGQLRFFEEFVTTKRDHVFSDVAVLIYVFDVSSPEFDDDLKFYDATLEALSACSPGTQLFVLVHKMDKVEEVDRERVFGEKYTAIAAHSRGLPLQVFKTSIWDETLYKAWSSIVYTLIPNIRTLESNLAEFADVVDADEVVLFEKATFLVISNATRRSHADVHRFEKISNIVKQFKLACMKAQAHFSGLKAGNSTFTAFIDMFTPNTYIMVVTSNITCAEEAVALNIALAQPHFERLISDL